MALGTDWFKSSVSQAGITGSNPVGATIIRGVVKFKIRLYSLLLLKECCRLELLRFTQLSAKQSYVGSNPTRATLILSLYI